MKIWKLCKISIRFGAGVQNVAQGTRDCKNLALLKARALSFSGLKLTSRADEPNYRMIHQSDSFMTIQCSVKWKLGVHINSLDCTCLSCCRSFVSQIWMDLAQKSRFKGKMGSPRLVQGSWGKAHEPSPIWVRAGSSLGSACANPTGN